MRKLAIKSILLICLTAPFGCAGIITLSSNDVPPSPPYPPLPLIGDATGSNLTGAGVEAEIQTQLGTRSYYQTPSAIWTDFGNGSGGVILPNFSVTLSGDSHANAFQVQNTGTTYLLNISVDAGYRPPFSLGTNSVAFDLSSLGSGFTTDSSNGTVAFFYPVGSNVNTPYYANFILAFDGFGLAPGASAYLIVPADIVAPEPSTCLLGVAGIGFLLFQRVRALNCSRTPNW